MDLLAFSTVVDSAPGLIAIAGGIATAVMWKQWDREQRCWAVFAVSTALLVWAYMNSMEKVADAWKNPQYSHGYLIPVIAGALLFARRKPFVENVVPWHQYLGLGIVIVATIVRIIAAQYVVMTLDRVMLLPCLFGIMLVIGGIPALKWSAGPILFLAFMYPFPRALEQKLLNPLQALATMISHYALETLGIECYRQGNRIVLDGIEMGVVDACSGLRMLTIFGALATAIAMISTNRPLWERIFILFSAIPIALAVNSIRITVTGLAYVFVGNKGEMEQIINMFAHDLAGWVMMPMALGLLYLEYQLLSKLVIEEEPETLSPLTMG
jgi:exosortase